MFVVVAINAEQFPVAAIGRVVLVVVVLVMDRELVQVGLRKLARAAATDPWKQPQGLGAVSLLALVPRTARVGDDSIEPAEVGGDTFTGGHAVIVIIQREVVAKNSHGAHRIFIWQERNEHREDALLPLFP